MQIERQAAREMSIRKYANRIIGNLLDLPVIEYHGSFDCQAVADSVPIPRSHNKLEHKACWDQFFKAFDQWWNDPNQHAEGQ